MSLGIRTTRRNHRWPAFLSSPRWRHVPKQLLAFPRVTLGHIDAIHKNLKPLQRAHFSKSVTLRESVPAVEEQTIYALSTAAGRAAIAVIRISGSRCQQIYHLLCPDALIPKPRCVALRTLYSPSNAFTAKKEHVLDPGALVLYLPAPRTITGEDVLELHVHGGPAIVKAVLAAIGDCNGLLQSSKSGISSQRPIPAKPNIRYAEPGEFTHRSFHNNRISLLAVESLGGTLAAVTSEQLRLSTSSHSHTSILGQTYESWRQQLLHARGELEALIDFQEDQHFDESPLQLASSVARQVRSLIQQIEIYRSNAVRGELLRNGIGISLLGMPNVGKSSVLNMIVGREAAIVSREAGTTRDVVEVGIDLGGFFVRVGDTAGVRGSYEGTAHHGTELGKADVAGDIEAEGIRRAKRQAQQSDLVILVLSAEKSLNDQGVQLQLDDEIIGYTKQLAQQGKKIVVLVNKMDLYDAMNASPAQHTDRLRQSINNILPDIAGDQVFFISCRQAVRGHRGSGSADSKRAGGQLGALQSQTAKDPGNLQAFLSGLITQFKAMTSVERPTPEDPTSAPPSESYHPSLGATQRQRQLLSECEAHLASFLSKVPDSDSKPDPCASITAAVDFDQGSEEEQEVDIVAAAESLRSAAACLAKITGKGEGAGDVEEVLGVVFEK